MGYHITFRGEVFVDPPLSSKDREVLEYIFNSVIEALGEESSYDAGSMEEFWKQIVEHVLPDYVLNGHFEWDASSSNDGTGILWICGKQAEAVSDAISNPGPSWEREE
jgi:hypothetical protein